VEKCSLYMDKIHDKLIRYNTKLARIKGKAAKVPVNMKPEYLGQVAYLEKKCDDFMKKYDQLKICNAQVWENGDSGAKKAWSELENAVDKAVDKADIFILKKIIRDNSNKCINESRYLKFCEDKRS